MPEQGVDGPAGDWYGVVRGGLAWSSAGVVGPRRPACRGDSSVLNPRTRNAVIYSRVTPWPDPTLERAKWSILPPNALQESSGQGSCSLQGPIDRRVVQGQGEFRSGVVSAAPQAVICHGSADECSRGEHLARIRRRTSTCARLAGIWRESAVKGPYPTADTRVPFPCVSPTAGGPSRLATRRQPA